MKYWTKYVKDYPTRQITFDDLKNNRNLRRFRNIRILFGFLNPSIALFVLAFFLLR